MSKFNRFAYVYRLLKSDILIGHTNNLDAVRRMQ